MKKALLGICLTTLAVNAHAAVEVISTKTHQSFGIFEIIDHLYCQSFDSDGNGINDKALVTLKLDSIGTIGVLAKNYISEEIRFDKNDVCDDVRKIKDGSFMNFGAGYGYYDSVVVMQDGILIEDIKLTLQSHVDADGKSVSVTIKDRIEIPVN